jgi:hypothetical protein
MSMAGRLEQRESECEELRRHVARLQAALDDDDAPSTATTTAQHPPQQAAHALHLLQQHSQQAAADVRTQPPHCSSLRSPGGRREREAATWEAQQPEPVSAETAQTVSMRANRLRTFLSHRTQAPPHPTVCIERPDSRVGMRRNIYARLPPREGVCLGWQA